MSGSEFPLRAPRWLQILIPLLVLGVAVAGFMALRATRAQRPPVVVEEKAYPVQVLEVQPGPLAPEILLYGRVESPRTAVLSAAVGADVVEVTAREGDTVAQGSQLLTLDDSDIRLRVAQRQADVDEAGALIDSEQTRHKANLETLSLEQRVVALAGDEVKRIESLQGRGLSSRSLRDQARQDQNKQAMQVIKRQQDIADHDARLVSLKARLARVEALLAQARLDLGRTRVRAPFTGRITSVSVAPGDRVAIGSPLLEMFDIDAVELRAQVPSSQLSVVRAALSSGVPVHGQAMLDTGAVTVRLDRFAARTDPASGGIDGLLAVPRGEQLTIGRIVPVRLRLPPRPGLVELPFEALYGRNRVYVLADERMRGVAVERVGERRDANGRPRVLVASPELRSGDRVIVTQLPNAVSGLRVSIAEDLAQGS